VKETVQEFLQQNLARNCLHPLFRRVPPSLLSLGPAFPITVMSKLLRFNWFPTQSLEGRHASHFRSPAQDGRNQRFSDVPARAATFAERRVFGVESHGFEGACACNLESHGEREKNKELWQALCFAAEDSEHKSFI